MIGPFDFPPGTTWGEFAFYRIDRGTDNNDWQNDQISNQGHIVSSNKNIIQYDGFGTWTLTTECWFVDPDQFRVFAEMRGSAAEMAHRAGLTVTASPDQVQMHPDGPYAHFLNVTLHQIRDAHMHPAYPHVVVATVTFVRDYDGLDLSTYGYGYYWPEEEA